MATLVFKNSQLQSLLQLTRQATFFRASFSDSIHAYEQDTGLSFEFGKDLSNYKQINHPTLWLVKDTGIYLMTSAQLDPIPADKSHVCYAEGYRPTDANLNEKCREAVGGDDFVETIPFNNELQRGILRGADICIEVTPADFTIILVYAAK